MMQLSFELQSIYVTSLANEGTMRYCVSYRVQKRKKKKNFGSTERKPIMRGPVISFNPRNKRRLPSRASFLRSGQVPGLCAQVEQKHFYPTAEFLRRRRSRVKDIQRERQGGQEREGERERKLRQKIDWKIMCCEILD